MKYEDLELGETKLLAAEDVASKASPVEEFISENKTPVIILAAALVLAVIPLIVLLSVHSAKKRRRAAQRTGSGQGRRYRD